MKPPTRARFAGVAAISLGAPEAQHALMLTNAADFGIGDLRCRLFLLAFAAQRHSLARTRNGPNAWRLSVH